MPQAMPSASLTWPCSLQWLHDMQTLPLVADAFCFSSLLSLRKTSDWSVASQLLQSMTRQTIQPLGTTGSWQIATSSLARDVPQREVVPVLLSFDAWRSSLEFFWSRTGDVFSSGALMNQLQKNRQWDLTLAHLETFQHCQCCDQQMYHAAIAALKDET